MTTPAIETDPADRANMVKYGISMVPTAYYQFKDYRYARLEDAIAQAQRHERMARQR